MNLDQPRSSGAHKILTELLCPALSRNSLAATRPRFDFIYTKNFARPAHSEIFNGDDLEENGSFVLVKRVLTDGGDLQENDKFWGTT